MKNKYFFGPSNYIYNIIILLSLSLLCASLFAHITSTEYLKLFYLNYVYYFIPISLILLFFRFFSNITLITYINIFLLSIGGALIILEIVFKLNIRNSMIGTDIDNRAYHAKKLGLKFDKRTKFQVYKEMQKNNIKVVPSIPPNDFFINYKTLKSKKDIYALSGISNSKTVFCNEGGKRVIYDSDRHGFRNREELWEKKEIDFILLGDSLAQGACVEDKDTIHERIMFYTNKSLLNLGFQGHGPLMQLAALKEYGSIKKPKKIIWFYSETNDIDNLVYEYQWEVFQKYLAKPNYSQNLILKQNQIDEGHRQVVESIYASREFGDHQNKKNKQYTIERFWFDFKQTVKLYNLRLFVSYFIPREYSLVNEYYSPLKTFEIYYKILDEAIKTADNWGGQIYFVYYPQAGRYFNKIIHPYPLTKYEYMKKK